MNRGISEAREQRQIVFKRRNQEMILKICVYFLNLDYYNNNNNNNNTSLDNDKNNNYNNIKESCWHFTKSNAKGMQNTLVFLASDERVTRGKQCAIGWTIEFNNFAENINFYTRF